MKTDLQYDESVGLDSEISSDDYYGAVRKQQVKQVHQDPQFRLRSQTTRYGLDGRDLSCVHKYSSAGDEYNEGSPRSDTEGYEYPDY